MNIAVVLNLLGKVLLVDAMTLTVPLIVSFLYRDGQASVFLYTFLIVLAVSFGLSFARAQYTKLRSREGFAVVALSWVLLSAFGALPFYIGGWIPHYVDCLFETVSGYTTTGATILRDVEILPPSILMWRSFTHWVGGMGVLILTLALIPKMGGRSLYLMRAELPGPSADKLVPKIGRTAKIMYMLYLGLTIVLILCLLLCGMNLFDAVIHAFGAAGTGGFSNYNLSVGHFQSPVVDNVLSVFMLVFSINFTLYYYLLRKNYKAVLQNTELKTYLTVVAAAVLVAAFSIRGECDSVWTALRHAFFQVSSVVTTTGYATRNFNAWPMLAKAVLLFLMLMGACAGSTGGGLKVIRMCILGKSVRRDIKRNIHPKGVSVIRVDGRPVPEDIVAGVSVFFFAYIAVIALSSLLISVDGFDTETTLSAVLACVSNIGPGLGEVGPIGNFSGFSAFSKIVLTMDMLLGRLDIYPILMLFSVSTWKRT